MTAHPPAKGKPPSQEKVIATNRRAWHDFEIEESFEAGIMLAGSEVKAIRAGRADLKEAFAEIHQGEMWLSSLTITPLATSTFAPPPARRRKLLVHATELDRLVGKVAHKGMALIPLKLYFNARGWAKVEVGVGKRFKKGDKREVLKKKIATREMRQARED